MNLTAAVFLLLGLGFLVAGTWLIAPAAGLITAGLGMAVAGALALDADRVPKRAGGDG